MIRRCSHVTAGVLWMSACDIKELSAERTMNMDFLQNYLELFLNCYTHNNVLDFEWILTPGIYFVVL